MIDLKAEIRAFPYISPDSSILGSGQQGIAVPNIPPPISPVPPGPITVPGIPTTPVSKPGIVQGGVWYPVELKQPDIKQVTKFFGKALSGLDKVIKFLTPILSLLELYVSSFNSFSAALKTAINAVQKFIKKQEETLGNEGIYMNVIIPPAFLALAKGNFKIARMYSGGFQGFLGRLQTSLHDQSDTRRPDFPSREDIVGGAILLVDTDSISKFFKTWKALTDLLGEELFTPPPPPRNIRGRSGYFQDGEGKVKFGIQLDWDAPVLPSDSFQISRSYIPGGEVKLVDDIPTNIKDLIKVISTMLATHKAEFPKKLERVYSDDDFNLGKVENAFAALTAKTKGPVTVLADFVTGGGSYIDYDIPGFTGSGEYVRKGTELDALHPFSPNHDRYYYVIKSSTVGILGAPSRETRVSVRVCDNSFITANVIEHVDGSYEMLSDGFSALNKWSSKRIKNVAPWVVASLKFLNKLLENLKGKVKDSSDSFTNFVEQLAKSIENFLTLLKIIQTFIYLLQQFIIDSSAAFLWVPPDKGGSDGFVQRVRNAKLRPGQTPFSGPSGITAGVVYMFGYSGSSLTKLTPAEQMAFKKEFQAVADAFKLMTSLFSK